MKVVSLRASAHTGVAIPSLEIPLGSPFGRGKPLRQFAIKKTDAEHRASKSSPDAINR